MLWIYFCLVLSYIFIKNWYIYKKLLRVQSACISHIIINFLISLSSKINYANYDPPRLRTPLAPLYLSVSLLSSVLLSPVY